MYGLAAVDTASSVPTATPEDFWPAVGMAFQTVPGLKYVALGLVLLFVVMRAKK